MTIRPIKTARDYHKALKEIEKLWDAKPNTPKGDRLDVLVTLVEAYEGIAQGRVLQYDSLSVTGRPLRLSS
jgi:antitoxin component HigA of HigAB toxin-antitoxin module